MAKNNRMISGKSAIKKTREYCRIHVNRSSFRSGHIRSKASIPDVENPSMSHDTHPRGHSDCIRRRKYTHIYQKISVTNAAIQLE